MGTQATQWKRGSWSYGARSESSSDLKQVSRINELPCASLICPGRLCVLFVCWSSGSRDCSACVADQRIQRCQTTGQAAIFYLSVKRRSTRDLAISVGWWLSSLTSLKVSWQIPEPRLTQDANTVACGWKKESGRRKADLTCVPVPFSWCQNAASAQDLFLFVESWTRQAL